MALLLGLFILHLGVKTMRHLQRSSERATRRHDALLATRILRTVLRAELAMGEPGADWSVDGDSVTLRAFRGSAVICATGAAADRMTVAYAGQRLPDPMKDSVEVTTATGRRLVFELLSTESAVTPCPVAWPPEEGMDWRIAGSVPRDAVFARVFESGSYHLQAAALRYRIGGGGRQPLTPAVWQDAGTGFRLVDSALVLELEPNEGYGAPRSGFLSWTVR